MSNKKKAIIGITIGLIVIFISFIAVLLFTSLLFDGKYNLLKEKPVIIEKNGKTPVNNKTVENQSYHIYDLVKEQSGKDIKDLFKDAKTDWVYAEYDENASDTSDFTVVIIGTYKINNEERLSIGILDENKYGIVDGDFEKENVSIEYGKYTYDIKILSEQEISLKRNNEAEKILKLVEKKVSWRISKHNNIVKYYEETIEKLNNNSELSDKETLKVLAFALVYLDVEKSNKEAIIPDIGYNLAISKVVESIKLRISTIFQKLDQNLIHYQMKALQERKRSFQKCM